MENNLISIEEQVNNAVAEKDYVAMWNNESNASAVGRDWCSYVLNTQEDKEYLLKRITETPIKLQEAVNEVLEIEGIYLENVEIPDQNTGERKVMPRMLLITADKVYSTLGITAFNNMTKILKYVGLPTTKKPIKLKVKMTSSNNKNYYSFQKL
jgi:hypothetical protein